MAKSKSQPLNNAVKIIERFGGIRPMAAKIDVPVTTVQGWKKRNVIPATRRDQILSAAQSNNIDLSDIANGNEKPSAENNAPPKAADTEKPVERKSEPKSVSEKTQQPENVTSFKKKQEIAGDKTTHDSLMEKIEENNRKAVVSSAWIAAVIVVLGIIVAAVLLWPLISKEGGAIDNQQISQKIEQLETKVEDVDQRTSTLNRIVPEDLSLKVEVLQNQARDLQKTVNDLTDQAKEFSSNTLGPNAGQLSDRLEFIEKKVASLSGSGNFSALIGRVQQLEDSLVGQKQLQQSVSQLENIVGGMQNDQSLSSGLQEAQNENEGPLGQTLQGVSGNDLKAAAMLLAFSKFRDTLNREEAFQDDIVLLKKLAGDDPELQGALDKLAPQAVNGVLSPSGLSEELKTMTGDIVFSSLKGEDVSIKEKAIVRLNNVFQVEKEGKPVLATDTQITVAEAQQLLDDGNIEGALAKLQSLEGEAGETAQPLVEKAQATLLAEQVQDMISESILSKVSGSNLNPSSLLGQGGISAPNLNNIDFGRIQDSLGDVIPADVGGGREVIRDEESGVNILPNARGFRGFSDGR
ncbi:MAG: mitofilin family membrane protein [Pseudomonadota bacterium]